MTTKNTGGHAFPTLSWEYDGGGRVLQYQEPGMTLRDYFAAKALEGICASGPSMEWSDLRIAREAYALADAMLKVREEV